MSAPLRTDVTVLARVGNGIQEVHVLLATIQRNTNKLAQTCRNVRSSATSVELNWSMSHQRKFLRIRGWGTPTTVGDKMVVKKKMLFNPVLFSLYLFYCEVGSA